MIETNYLVIETEGNTDIIDITDYCHEFLEKTSIRNGTMIVFNPGSTGGLSTIEYEPNLLKDLKNTLDLVAPTDKIYEHNKTWHDDNGSGHIRSTLMGPSISIPFIENKLTLGAWQQIIFCDFDSRPRRRQLVVQINGE